MDPGSAFAARKSIEQGLPSPSETGSVMSIDESIGRSRSVVSPDDSDVRIAASALAELGNPGMAQVSILDHDTAKHKTSDFVRSPQNTTFLHQTPNNGRERPNPNEPEPILKLFTKAHPWVGGTINGSLSAYSTTKNFSPGFVQHSANAIERNIGGPVANAVASVGRITGVESGLRWYYGGNVEMSDNGERAGNKRQRTNENDLETGVHRPRSRRESEDSLPPYGRSKPPSYREEPSPAGRQRPTHNRSFSNQVIVTTSSLGVALSTTSRRSLRSCLNLLERGAEHTNLYMNALSLVLQQYDEARESYHQRHSSLEKGERESERPKTPDHDEAARRLAAIIKQHSDDIWRTIQTVVNSVSNSAGAALPENVRVFVRNQLMSLPQRWKWVSDHSGGLESETSRSAHRMVAFAKEGLDMMGQISEAFRVTLVGAEQWLERAGRRDPEAGMYSHQHEDVKEIDMSDAPPPEQQDQTMSEKQ